MVSELTISPRHQMDWNKINARCSRMTQAIWVIAGLVYAVFWLWYARPRKKITPLEADRFQQWATDSGIPAARAKGLRDFFANDDGRDFVMVNLITLKKPVRESSAKLAAYQRVFLGQLLRKAGHPVITALRCGANIEHVNCEQNSDWAAMAAIRYRSRRDLLEILPKTFGCDHHQLKLDAVASTIAFPAGKWFILAGPKIVVALITLLVACILELLI
ncbi:hypothetical protein HCU74_04735 [Spongiibacter sp. KMU-166]|uniref:Uncharacterized protein n=1 Tax=Spongiibacter thalassae TaxID=2721624 RepID=A0ABX1GCN7_9GAMM|nr:hypothetical protein [Spongiibacter thalassae]NKI16725.1 hypothetical protein [Spongiibacter thalassae]